ncbi:hypothetical protein [Streptomyces sp. NPDC046985]|uniref:hypothetical protein n=1 Tax=Streptomyces sp. NPDC046985 TaxID=3155377 RepID=UPI0033FFB814
MSTPPFEETPRPRVAGTTGPRRPAGPGRTAARGGGRGLPRRVLGPVVCVLAVLGLCGAAWTSSTVRSVLRDSFTERQQSYIELYSGKEPFFDGGELVVPLELVEHGESGGRRSVRTWVQAADGRRLAARTETVATKPGALIGLDVRLRLKKGEQRDADLVEVTLPGHPQRLRMHLH